MKNTSNALADVSLSSVWWLQDFFKKHGVAVMTIRELFDFIVDPTIADDAVESYLDMVWFLPFCSQILKNLGPYKQ